MLDLPAVNDTDTAPDGVAAADGASPIDRLPGGKRRRGRPRKNDAQRMGENVSEVAAPVIESAAEAAAPVAGAGAAADCPAEPAKGVVEIPVPVSGHIDGKPVSRKVSEARVGNPTFDFIKRNR